MGAVRIFHFVYKYFFYIDCLCVLAFTFYSHSVEPSNNVNTDRGNFEVAAHYYDLTLMLPPSSEALKFSEVQLSHTSKIIHMQRGTHMDGETE